MDTSTRTPNSVSPFVEEHPYVQRMDGGYHAWSTLIGAWLILIATFGYTNAFGVYQDLYTRADTESASKISWIGSTQLFFLVAMGLPAGKLLDKGYFRHTTIFGSVLYVFSMFMVSLAHPDKYYQVFLSQGVGLGIGAGLLYVPSMAVQSHHWRTYRALAMGVVTTGSSIGGIIFPIMLNRLFQGSVGFAWGVRASAFLVLGLLVVGNLLMTENRPAKPTEAPKPDMKSIMTDPASMWTNFGTFCALLGLFFPYFYLQLYAVLHNVDPNVAFYTLAIMNAASIPGRIGPSLLADLFGSFNVIIPSTFACAVLLLALLGIKSAGSTIVFAIIYGFTSGAFLSLCSPVLATLSRNTSEIGVRIGFGFFVSSFGALVGAPIDGALLGNSFPWYKAIIFSAVTMFVSAISLSVGRHFQVQRRGTRKV